MLKFDLPKGQSSIIKVLGVGGGGNNAVNHMYKQGIKDVDFIQCNTDAQVLEISPVPNCIQLGITGLGAGAKPEVGRKAAEESIEEIRNLLDKNTQMLFITAGMGGGTGTGAAPVIASIARELDILTVGIVTLPFSFEGRKRRLQAEQGIDELKKYVDTLLVINNDKLRELYGDLKLTEAFQHADDVLSNAARGIAEIITVKGYINVDFEDVKTVMRNSGKAIMGSGLASGENRAIKAAEVALSSPLLNDNDIHGAQNMLLYIASGKDEVTMDEVTEITDFIQESAGLEADIIWGTGIDERLGEDICITLIATGFETNGYHYRTPAEPAKNKINLHETTVKNIASPAPAVIPVPLTEIKEEQLMSLINKSQTPVPGPGIETTASSQEGIHLKESAPPANNEVTENLSSPILITRQTSVSNATMSDNRPEIRPRQQPSPDVYNDDFNDRRTTDRIRKLREISNSWKTPSGLNEMEAQPAYIRRSVQLNETPDSSQSNVAKYSLSNDGSSSEIKGNSYLHDNVD